MGSDYIESEAEHLMQSADDDRVSPPLRVVH